MCDVAAADRWWMRQRYGDAWCDIEDERAIRDGRSLLLLLGSMLVVTVGNFGFAGVIGIVCLVLGTLMLWPAWMLATQPGPLEHAWNEQHPESNEVLG